MVYCNGMRGRGAFRSRHRQVLSKCFYRKALTGLFLAASLPATTYSATSELSCPLGAVEVTPKSPSSSVPLAASPSQYNQCKRTEPVLKRLIQSNRLQVVDVRKPDGYWESRLPGAVNIPPHRVKAKGFLKGNPIALVGSGINDAQLFDACINLLNHGFKSVSVLEGGVQRWHKLLGTEYSQSPVNVLPVVAARDTFVALKSGKWMIVNISDSPELERQVQGLFPEHEQLTLGRISGLDKATAAQYKFLVLGESEKQYAESEAVFHRAGILSGFWLEGGVERYSRFLTNRASMMAKLHRPAVRKTRCGAL